MTDEEFSAFCAEHPDLFFEMTAEGEIIVMPPTHFGTGASNFDIARQLGTWAWGDGRGACSDSSGGFVLPDGARRSPDAAWTLRSRIAQLTPAERYGFLHLCPHFVIELRSSSDRLPGLREKMLEYLANGAQLGWLIEPQACSVTIYRTTGEPEKRSDIDSIAGEGPVAGFVLDLRPVRNPLGD